MIDTRRLRCIIGWLGMLLPWIVLIQSLIYGYGFPDSISETYFRDTCIAPFMIVLGSASILLCTYNGYTRRDDLLNTAAGIAGLGVCLFPCAAYFGNIGTFQLPYQISDIIHMVSALLFFGILAFNSMFQFTKGSDNPTNNKKRRNLIFRVCGFGMVASFILLPLAQFNIIRVPHVIWVIETIALAFFGISWLTKANCYNWLFADPVEK